MPSPSHAHRWIGGGCTAAPAASAAVPKPPRTEDAAAGVRVHTAAGRAMHAYLAGEPEPDLESLPPGDRETVRRYVQIVTGYVTPNAMVQVEKKMTSVDMDGTPDCIIMGDGTLDVFDLKNGWDIVDVQSNWQLLCYAYLAATLGYKFNLARMHIFQPHPYHPDGPHRTWAVPRENLDHFFNVIDRHLYLARTTPVYAAGPHCNYCPALSTCPAARGTALTVSELAYTRPESLPDTFVANEIRRLSAALSVAQKYVDALRTETVTRLKSGRRIPGVELRRTAGRLEWSDPTHPALVRATTGVETTKSSPITPTQALAAGAPERLIRRLTTRPSGVKLSTVDPAELARKEFG